MAALQARTLGTGSAVSARPLRSRRLTPGVSRVRAPQLALTVHMDRYCHDTMRWLARPHVIHAGADVSQG